MLRIDYHLVDGETGISFLVKSALHPNGDAITMAETGACLGSSLAAEAIREPGTGDATEILWYLAHQLGRWGRKVS